ncbi:MAG: RIP metalloprotease RseP [Gammaproteobacteria bacterium]|nr:RIP metalloprotease RseP [Gammaproteobacteria bacterium]
MSILSIIIAIFSIFAIVLIHELGHFSVARLCKVRVERFSVGFGKALWSYVSKKTGTEYRLAIIPFGGYVKMLGEDGTNVSASERQYAFDLQPVYKRAAIVIAGPLTNFILAIALFWMVFIHGVPHYAPVIGKVASHSIAARAGVNAGDEILQVNHQRTHSWQQVLMAVLKKAGSKGNLLLTLKTQDQPAAVIRQLDLKTWHVDSRKPRFLRSLGITPYQPAWPAKVWKILPNSPLKKTALRVGDTIVGFNNKPTIDMLTLSQLIQKHPNQNVHLTVLRNNQHYQIKVRVGERKFGGHTYGFLGFESHAPKWPAHMRRLLKYSPLAAIGPAVIKTWNLTKFNLVVLGKLLIGKVSLNSLGGPISIVQMAGSASMAGWFIYIGFIAFVSIAIGFLNLLPIPGLDGGHLLYLVIESIFRKPIPARYQLLGFKLGLGLLLFLMLYATINDIIRLF